jgi:tRNA threonylcarbamoyladenosine biosynthesis protein TsaB
MILNIETATTNCSVSIAQEGLVVAFKEIAELNYSHAEQLHVFIQEVLLEAAVSLSDLKAIAVSKGPGSYTGLRIGVSAAKGLCYALNIPLIAIPTLKSLSLQCQPKAGEVVLPMLDARRMEVYISSYDHKGKELHPTEAKILEENSLSEWMASYSKVYFIGSGAQKAFEVHHQSNISVLDTLPSAKEMAGLSYQKYVAKDFEDVAYFEPYYLKDFMGPIPKKKQ